jgi:hypothetical protein
MPSHIVRFLHPFTCPNVADTRVAYLIELFPYAVRTRGIGVEQVFGKLGGFFSNFVNPIALNAIGWKYLAIYCGWIFFEFCFQFLFYPETSGRTLEELTFCQYAHAPRRSISGTESLQLTNCVPQCLRTKILRTRLSMLLRRRLEVRVRRIWVCRLLRKSAATRNEIGWQTYSEVPILMYSLHFPTNSDLLQSNCG